MKNKISRCVRIPAKPGIIALYMDGITTTKKLKRRILMRKTFSGFCPLAMCLLLSVWVLSGCDPQSDQAQDTPDASVVKSEIVSAPTSTPAQEQKLREAAKNGHVQTVKLLLEQGTAVNAPDEDNRTALMWAAFDGYTPVVQLLIDHGAEVNTLDNIGRTALMYASSGANIDTVRLLLSHQAETNITDNQEAWTALMFAAAEGQTPVVQALLDAGADPNLKDTDGDTAYNFAQQKGHLETAQLIKAR
ncbi:ankyrin repeat domain-containing protein [Planctomycetota bacterium]